MSDLRINSNNQTSYTPDVVGTQGTQSVPASQVQTTSGVNATTPEDGPLLGTDNSESVPPEGDVPDPAAATGELDPNGDPMAYATGLREEIEKQTEYQELYDQLAEIAAAGVPESAGAQALMAKLRPLMWTQGQIEDAQEEYDEIADFDEEADLDGDGKVNKDDDDIDGDTLTNDAEKNTFGSDAYNADTDGDNIVDWAEVAISNDGRISLKELDGYQNTDVNNSDVDGNGVIDGDQLSAEIKARYVGGGSSTGGGPGTNGTNGASGTDGPSTQTQNLLWTSPAADAQSPAWGDTASGNGDVVVNLAGENVEFSASEDGSDLILTNKATGETMTIEDYKSRRVYIKGTAGALSTNNFDSGNLGATDGNHDGVADTGINFASGMDISGATHNYDPSGGSLTINEAESTADTIVYDADGGSGVFDFGTMGSGVEAIEVTVEGDDVIVICKDKKDGETVKTFRLKGAKDEVESGAIHFQLADHGQYFYSAAIKATVDGGKGDDEITIWGGTARGNEGSDMLRGGEGDSTLDGGRGDDFVLGGSGTDTLIGGDEDDGMDFLHSGDSTGDTMRSGDGDDIVIVGNTATDAVYNLEGGEGQDLTNATNLDVVDAAGDAHGFDVTVNNPAGIITFIQQHKTDANSNLFDELEKLYNDTNGGLTGWMASAASDTLKNAASAFLIEKKKEWDAKYGGAHGDTFGGQSQGADAPDAPPPNGDAPTSQSDSTSTGLMFQSVGVEGIEDERRRERRRREQEDGVSEDGDIPSPMFD